MRKVLVAQDDQFLRQGERRAYDRSRLILDVHFDGKDATGVASTKDISVGGFYMNTQARIPEGAVVVYSNPGLGVGVRFQELTSEAKAILQQELSHD